jgi:phosphoenolpyruvate phosphomutase
MRKTTQLKRLLNSSSLEFLMEAHSGLSSRIVEEAGFKGIWASGLAISSALGVRDSNEASWTQVLEVAEFMNDAVSIPILLDGDTGYGNFNNVRRLVKKLCQRGIAGVCIEDKLFPKTNSFIQGEQQPLAPIEEFCGKIKAAKDSQTDSDFCLVARVEALIAGWSMDEAIKRANRYAEAGADGILIHSQNAHADQILEFAAQFQSKTPILIVPTKYYRVPAEIFEKAGISTVIWANHLLRASITAMSQTAKQIHEEKSLMGVEDRVAPLAEVFRLQRADELLEAENLYLTTKNRNTSAIILAASRGKELGDLTAKQPKCMLSVAGKPILEHLVTHLKSLEINDIHTVVGYEPDAVKVSGIQKIQNSKHQTTQELYSLSLAEGAFSDDANLILYGDILVRRYILEELVNAPEDLVILVDSSIITDGTIAIDEDRVVCTAPDNWESFQQTPKVVRFWPKAGETCHGQWSGVMKVSRKGRPAFLKSLGKLKNDPNFLKMGMPHLLQQLILDGHEVHALYVKGHCVNVNRLLDMNKAQSFLIGS